MDLSFIEEALDTFATFAGAIGDFLKLPIDLLVGTEEKAGLLGYDFEGGSEATSSNLEGLSSTAE